MVCARDILPEFVTGVPFFDLQRQFRSFRGELLAALAEVCETQSFILGAQVEALEKALQKFVGVPHLAGVSSGTDAETLILMAQGIGPGDAVVTTPFTFFATAASIFRLGATPIFVDIDPATLNLSPARLAEFLECCCVRSGPELLTTHGLKVKAVVPVHLFGLCADLDPILDICSEYALPAIEDAAQAIGAMYPSRKGAVVAGASGTASFFSFYPTKNLGAFGDAGLVATPHEALGHRLRVLRNHGMHPKYIHAEVGGNFRMDALQAAVLLRKLPALPGWSRRRWDIAQFYKSRFASFPDLTLPAEPYLEKCGDRGHIYHQFVVRTPRRDALRQHLTACGIGTEIYYPLGLHQQGCFASLPPVKVPVTEAAAREVLALPIFPELEDSEVLRVAEAVTAFF